MSAFASLPGSAATNLLALPTEGVRCAQPDTEAWIGDRCLGKGDLCVAEARVAWAAATSSAVVAGAGGGANFSLNYPAICLHGLAKGGPEQVSGVGGGRPHLYLLVRGDLLAGDEGGGGGGIGDSDGESNDDDDDVDGDNELDEPTTEVRFYADDPAALMPAFQAIAECQALHPDPLDDEDSGEEDDEEEGDEEEEEAVEEDEEDGYGDGRDDGCLVLPQPGFPDVSGDPASSAGSGSALQHQQQQQQQQEQQQPMDTDQFEDAT